MNTPEIPPPPNMPTIPDMRASMRAGALRIAIPGAVVAAAVSALMTFALPRLTAADPVRADDLRGDVRALTVKVDALAQAQRDLLERINRDADAAKNERLIEALRARGQAP